MKAELSKGKKRSSEIVLSTAGHRIRGEKNEEEERKKQSERVKHCAYEGRNRKVQFDSSHSNIDMKTKKNCAERV